MLDVIYDRIYGLKFQRVFRSRCSHLMIVTGAGGLGKTTYVTTKAKEFYGHENVITIKGYITEKGLYMALGELASKDAGVLIIDNAEEGLFTNNMCRSLLEQSAEKDEERTVYRITAGAFEEGGLSGIDLGARHKIIIITNHFPDDHPKLQALKTRAIIVEFDPNIARQIGENMMYEKLGDDLANRVKYALQNIKVYHLLTLRDFAEIVDIAETIEGDENIIHECIDIFFKKNAYLRKAYEIYSRFSRNAAGSPYSKAAMKRWETDTGMSARTYKNYVKMLRTLGVVQTAVDIELQKVLCIDNSGENVGKKVGKIEEKVGKTMGNNEENRGNIVEKVESGGENVGDAWANVGNVRENVGKRLGNSWENDGKCLGKSWESFIKSFINEKGGGGVSLTTQNCEIYSNNIEGCTSHNHIIYPGDSQGIAHISYSSLTPIWMPQLPQMDTDSTDMVRNTQNAEDSDVVDTAQKKDTNAKVSGGSD